MLTESEAALEGWRKRIGEAVTPNGQLLVGIVPELERILGPQPEVPEVGPVEARNRFQLLVARFLRVFARPDHPFVLFLDDLQWVDAASLQIIMQCANDAASRHILIIGAYRDGDIGPSHALALSLAALREAGGDIRTIHLKPLRVDAIARLAIDTFGEDAGRLHFLAELLVRKSAGNPFFVRRLLHLMHAQGLIRFNVDTQRWCWNDAEIERAPISDNVLDLMVLAIDRLPRHARRLLQTGSCIGHRFDLGTLAELANLSLSALSDQLRPAIEDGLLVQVRDTFQSPTVDNGPACAMVMLKFAHDRVQQAGYELLGSEERQALHHSIGRRLLNRSGGQREEQLFEIVDQFNLGVSHVVDDAERETVIELNLAAGRKAKESAAYGAAFEYLSVARRLLGAHAWTNRPDLAFTVHRELAESAYLAGEHVIAEEAVETSLEHAPSKVAEAELYGLRVLAATVAGDWERALHWGRVGLSVFGLEWPVHGLPEAIRAEVDAVMRNLGGRDIAGLIDEPDVEDADIRASMRLLSLLGAPAYFSGAPVLTFLLSRAVNLSLLHGPSPYSAFAYVLYGGTHNGLTGQYEVGFAFGKLALAMAKRFGNRAEECRTLEVYGVLVHHWKAPLRDGLPLLKEGFRAGVESGELAFAAFNLNSVLINALPAGLPLDGLLEEAEVTLDFATTQKNRTSVEIAVPYRQIARALTGATSRPDCFEDETFEGARFLAEAADNATALGHYWVARLQLAYLMGDHEQARMCSIEAEKQTAAGILGMITSAQHVFYTALTIAAAVQSPVPEGAPALARLRELHGNLANWAGYCPDNFSHKAALLEAEIARLEGRNGVASTLYRSAIAGAESQRFVQDEALAHELRARFLLGEHEPAFAAVHARLAHDRYRRWGATAKLVTLEAEFPHAIYSDVPMPRITHSIDQMALIRASQAISSETTPERLFEQIMRVVLEVAGAQRGVLALATDSSLTVHARIEAEGGVSVSLGEVALEDCADLPSTILRYVQRTKDVVRLSDAGTAGLFARDPAVVRRRVRSVLCIPLLKQSSLLGVIYLENNAMADAFAAELVEVGQVLAAQAVISLQNCSLVEKMQQLTSELEDRVLSRTRQLSDQIEARDRAENGLRAADRQKDEFLAMLAHELRNPLASISNASELMTRTGTGGARTDGLAALLKRQTRQLTRLVDDLLDLSRISRGLVTLEKAPVEIGEIMQQAVETVQSLIQEKGHRLLVAKPAHPLHVYGDKTRLVQAISNIIHNAAKYTDRGGEITLQVFEAEQQVGVTIQDNGVGIPADILPTLFDLFVQSERTLDRSQGGLGIGLSVVKRLIEMHNGSVQASSPGIGLGSSFTIRMPLAPPLQLPSDAPSQAGGPTPRSILIVDDNVDAADTLAMLLELDGHRVHAVYGAIEALEAAMRLKPDVLFLDIGLPGMDGYEVAQRLRSQSETSILRLVAITGYGQKEDRQRALASGFDDHLVKPVTPESLRTLFMTPMDPR